jgi:hypothetical protein
LLYRSNPFVIASVLCFICGTSLSILLHFPFIRRSNLIRVSLREYRLELNDEKTEVHHLPDGLFRKWVSEYHFANPRPKTYYGFKRFKETYLSVIKIDQQYPGTGIIDRFLADLVTRKHHLRVQLNNRSLPKVLSLLLLLAGRRTKAFPKVLAIIESILRSQFGSMHVDSIVEHLRDYMDQLTEKESDNRYLIAWICYFIRSNSLERKIKREYKFSDPIVRATYVSRYAAFSSCPDFRVFEGVKAASKRVTMLTHLDVFKPQ